MNHFEMIELYQKSSLNKYADGTYRRHYLNAHLALYDVAFSLTQFLSHKEKIAVIRQGSSVSEHLISLLLKIQIPIQFKEEGKNTIQFLDEIDKETNYVIWASENEISGEEIYSNKECLEIHQKLTSKRIFSIQLVNANRTMPTEEIFKNQYAVQIKDSKLSMHPQATTLVYSDKLKAPSLVGALQYSANGSLSEVFQHGTSELKMWPDRRCFEFKMVSGQAIIECLELPKALAFAPASLPTWVLETWKNWWPKAKSLEALRGFLVVSETLFQNDKNLEEKIHSKAKELARSSTWSLE